MLLHDLTHDTYHRYRHRLLHRRYIQSRSQSQSLAIRSPHRQPVPFPSDSESSIESISIVTVIDNLNNLHLDRYPFEPLNEPELKLDNHSNSNSINPHVSPIEHVHVIDLTSVSIDHINTDTESGINQTVEDDNDSSDTSYDEQLQEHKYDDFDNFNDSFVVTIHDQPSEFDSISVSTSSSSSNRIPSDLHTSSSLFSSFSQHIYNLPYNSSTIAANLYS